MLLLVLMIVMFTMHSLVVIQKYFFSLFPCKCFVCYKCFIGCYCICFLFVFFLYSFFLLFYLVHYFHPLSLLFIIIYESITISITIFIIIIVTIINIIIIDHICNKTWFGEESVSILFKRHCLPLLIRSDLKGKPH